MLKGNVKRALATAGLLATLGATMALFAPAASAASSYCGGWLNSGSECHGAPRSLEGVTGSGSQHAVCVWADNLGQNCSSGPHTFATVFYGPPRVRTPKIRNIGGSPNLVQGTAI